MSASLVKFLEKNELSRYSVGFFFLASCAHIIRALKKLGHGPSGEKPDNEEKVTWNAKFYYNFRDLLKVCFPRFLSFEVFGVLIECYLIFKRASITIETAKTVSRAGRHLVERKKELFINDLVDVALLAIPGTITHVGVWYIRSLVKENLKDNLHKHLSELYFAKDNIYHIASSGLIKNPERRFGEDSIKFCNTFINLFESLLKPVVNIMTLSVELAKMGGLSAPMFIASYYVFVASAKSLVLPNFSDMMALAQEREAKLRSAHNDLVQHAEEVAFYGGEQREKEHADELIESVAQNERNVKKAKWVLSLFDSVLIKYGSMFIGFVLCGIIVKRQSLQGVEKAALTEIYFKSASLCMPFLKAMGKLLSLNLKVAALHGSVQRVSELREVLDEVKNIAETDGRSIKEHYFYKEDCIEFSHVDVITPAKQCLIKDFSISIPRNSHVLIRGNNGSGKSAIIRALSELWPIQSGTISKPSREKFYIVPQRVYLPPGSLKTQLTYPMDENLVENKLVVKYAHSLGLEPVINRVGGLAAERDWECILSGGERQRVALVRVLVHKPVFAVLDECTSAVSVDDERILYATLQQSGITLITISHRLYLREIHDVIVEIQENGKYTITQNETPAAVFSPLVMKRIASYASNS